MALPNLAASADLSARGVDVSDTTLVDTMLEVASAVVRGAAGSPILQATSTVTLTGYHDDVWLDLPGQPVTAVSAVTLDGTTISDYTHHGGRLWRLYGWSATCEPAVVSVTMTHGLATTPPDVANLVCDLATAGILTAGDGIRDPRVVAEKIDDYSVTFAQGYETVASVFELPRATRLWLKARFGGGSGMVSHR